MAAAGLTPHNRTGVATVGTALGALALGIVATWAMWEVRDRWGYSATEAALDLATCWAFVGVGLCTVRLRPDLATGRLLCGVGIAWLAANLLMATSAPAAFCLGAWIVDLRVVFGVQIALRLPTGHYGSTAVRRVARASGPLIMGTGLLVLLGCEQVVASCRGCPPNLVHLVSSDTFTTAARTLHLTAELAFTLVVVAHLGRLLLKLAPPLRRILQPVLFVGIVVTTIIGVATIPRPAALVTGDVGILAAAGALLVPVAFGVSFLRAHLDKAVVGPLVVELRSPMWPEELERRLAAALHDPGLELLFWIPERATHIDSAGTAVPAPTDTDDRAVKVLGHDGAPIGALVHDRTLLLQRLTAELLEAVSAAATTAILHARLQAEARMHLGELDASRRRLVEASDAARRQVERDLHDGAQQRLIAVGIRLQRARDALGDPAETETARLLDEAAAELRAAMGELRDLANGIHPAVLVDEGIAAAIAVLAERLALPIDADVVCGRHAPLIESTAYFVVSEGLANVVKHARATRVCVTVTETGSELVLVIEDDGSGCAAEDDGGGCAATAAGLGLRGLAERVDALGGDLAFHSPRGGPTRLVVRLPLVPRDGTAGADRNR